MPKTEVNANAGGGGRHNQSAPFVNTQKRHPGLLYYYSCGYDVDHKGYNCTCPKGWHIPNVTHDMAHKVQGASMVAQHKTLPDRT